ncbi:MAG: 16S rRNA (cytidine(1402)-2'-O)-methyltransferase [Longimicrobiales bacterium]
MATLYLVSTPIGNLGDLSARAAETLRGVSRILAEDTRRTRVLADHVDAAAPLVSVHAHNERERIDRILGWLDAGEDLALVSDAGTPLVSDPGSRVVTSVVEHGHTVVPIPGASAPLSALVASGLPTGRFTFLGFIARKGKARVADLSRVHASEESTILFESPQRLVATLDDLADVCGGDREVCVARELTKFHEEFRRGTLEEVAGYYRERSPKGEVTIVVGPEVYSPSEEDVERAAQELAASLLREGMKPSAAAREVARRLDLARNEAYRIVHDSRGSSVSAENLTVETATDE